MAKQLYVVTGGRTWGRSAEVLSKAGVSVKPALVAADRRDRTAANRMGALFAKLTPGAVVLQGGARGADEMAAQLAMEYGLFPMTMPYAKFLGRGGGPARNRKMKAVAVGLRTAGWSVKVLSFHENLATSKGTLDMVRIMLDEQFIVHHISLVSASTLRSSKELRKLLKG